MLGLLAAVALVIAFGLALSLVWATVALVIHDPAVVLSIANAVLIPLSFASNIFVEPTTMPGWLRHFVDVNPLSHVASAARGLMNDSGSAGSSVVWSLTATAVIALVCAPITLRLYSKQA
ncbi:MAG TPA: ABC transporter permease [Mycobacteriales bacterium]|nr:ABC transporter permease [Mycobacteriales bacterium]